MIAFRGKVIDSSIILPYIANVCGGIPEMKLITITDIAKKLGIAPSTVSRALRDHPDISEETKNRVKKLVRDSRYTPNAISDSLRNRRTTNIGVIIPEIAHD